ncbi:aldolase/citrate lyase family protein, partial [Nonomuraea sp. NPDC004297]
MTRRLLVTWLYVPGDRPDRFAKAVASGADVVIIDLEDAVAYESNALSKEHRSSRAVLSFFGT